MAGAPNRRFELGVEPQSSAAGTLPVPSPRSRATPEGRRMGLPSGYTMHAVLAVRTFQCGMHTALRLVPSTNAHNGDVRI
jgi:hypothetical protein